MVAGTVGGVSFSVGFKNCLFEILRVYVKEGEEDVPQLVSVIWEEAVMDLKV